MNGAREYARMFSSGQHGRLYLDSGNHARGLTFHIWVLPSGVSVDMNNPRSIDGAVEVYGVVDGRPGWTESYGWLHHGKWELDFAALVESRKVEIAQNIAIRESEKRAREEAETKREAELSASY